MTKTKRDLVAAVGAKLNLEPKEAERVVLVVLDTLFGYVKSGERVELRGYLSMGCRKFGP